MAKKTKFEEGQCFEKDNHVYMLMYQVNYYIWVGQNTLTKELSWLFVKDLLKMRRPFTNVG